MVHFVLEGGWFLGIKVWRQPRFCEDRLPIWHLHGHIKRKATLALVHPGRWMLFRVVPHTKSLPLLMKKPPPAMEASSQSSPQNNGIPSRICSCSWWRALQAVFPYSAASSQFSIYRATCYKYSLSIFILKLSPLPLHSAENYLGKSVSWTPNS